MTNLEKNYPLHRYALFFCLAITLHNFEEAIWLPTWSQSAYSIQQPVSSNEFHFAVIVITALAYLTAFCFIEFSNSRIAIYAFTGFLGSMIVNVFFPHLLSTIIMQTYAPGLITGILLIVPINSITLYHLHKNNFVNLGTIFISTIVVGAFLLLLIPILFQIANRLIIF